MRFRSLRVGSVAGALVLFLPGLAMVPANSTTDPALAWTQKDLALTAYEGTSTAQSLDLTFTSSAKSPGVKIDGNLRDVASVDMSNLNVTSAGHASVQLTINLPAGSKGSYVGNIQLTDQGRPLSQPLHVAVQTAKADSQTIPTQPQMPSPDRIGTWRGMPVTVDVLNISVASSVADPDALARQLASTYGGSIVAGISDLGYYELRFSGATPTSLAPTKDAISAVSGVARVTYALLSSANQYTNDPETWGSDPTVQTDTNWNLRQIDAISAWNTTTGQGTVVGVVDSGFYTGHEDLAPNIVRSSGVLLAAPDHGTHVAGTACAAGNNGKGVVGVAWNCLLNLQGLGWEKNLPDGILLSGIKQIARSSLNTRVVNISYGEESTTDCTTASDSSQLINGLASEGNTLADVFAKYSSILWVLSAGNSGFDSSCSAYGNLGNRPDLPNVVTVAASSIQGALAHYSVHGAGVTVAAPGGESDAKKNPVHAIFSTWPYECGAWNLVCTDKYAYDAGTSMAAPHVTGTAALAFSAVGGKISAADVKKCLIGGAAAGGMQLPGQSTYIINARKTVDCAQGLLRPATAVQDLFTDGNSGFALLYNGAYSAWGLNQAGQLGLGSTSDQEPQTTLSGLTGVKSIVQKLGTTFAIMNDGTVQAWGSNNRGQLGDGTTVDKHQPQPIPGLTDVKDIHIDYPVSGRGATTIYAIKTDGSVMAWGDNPSRLLINGLSDPSVLTPFPVVGLNGVSQIRSQDFTVWALRTDGSVVSWGDNYDGQYGNPLYFGLDTSAPQVSQISGVVSIEPGWHSMVALKADGTVWGWGRDGTAGLLHGWNTSTPISLGLSDVKSIFVQPGGGATGFALKNDGTAWAWGWNCSNEAGVGVIGNCIPGGSAAGNVIWAPTQVPNLSNVTQLYSGLALTADGSVWAWSNPLLLGQGSSAGISNVPMKVPGISPMVKVFYSPNSYWALNADGSLYGWGDSNMLAPNTTYNPTCMVGCKSP